MDARISHISLRSAALSVADLVLPRVCIVCGRTLLMSETHLCTACAADLPRTFFARQRENPMAEGFNAMVERELAGNGASEAPTGLGSMPETQPYSYAAALLYYRGDSPYSQIPQALKYGRDFEAGTFFARMLGRELAGSPLFADVDAVIPVPLHWLRQWRRGYNQAEVIARGIAEELEVPMLTGVLRRVRRTRTQTRLDAAGRYGNVRSAFLADGSALVSSGNGMPHHLLLVDDVYTTGATLLASERALRAALVQDFGSETASSVRISVATMAHVGK